MENNMKKPADAVDGQNPAPPSSSLVVQDFVHQQYES